MRKETRSPVSLSWAPPILSPPPLGQKSTGVRPSYVTSGGGEVLAKGAPRAATPRLLAQLYQGEGARRERLQDALLLLRLAKGPKQAAFTLLTPRGARSSLARLGPRQDLPKRRLSWETAPGPDSAWVASSFFAEAGRGGVKL